MPEGCLCGDPECARCFPSILDDARRERDEALADDLHQRQQDAEDEHDA